MFTQPSIQCGCGFVAQGPSLEANQAAYDAHKCYKATVSPRWHESVFSPRVTAALIVLIIVAGILIEGGAL